jgi:glutamate racemase
VPNKDNKSSQINKEGSFLYDYKYGRTAAEIQEYTKSVPFSRNTISDDILNRLKNKIPKIYQLIRVFSNTNKKTEFINDKGKI